MDARATLHERHHATTLQPDVLIVEPIDVRGTIHERHQTTALQPDVVIEEPAGPGLGEVHLQISDALLDDSVDDSSARLLTPDVLNSSIAGDSGTGGAGEDDDVGHPSSVGLSGPWDDILHKRYGSLPEDLDTLDIMREASRLLRRQSDLFSSLAAAWILPLSIIILAHVVVTRPIIRWGQNHVEVALFEESVAAGIKTPFTQFICLKIAEFFVTFVLDIPLAVSLAALSKAGIVYTVACTYAGVKVSFFDIIYRVVPRVWRPLVITYFSSLAIFIGAGVTAVLLVGVANGVFAALHASSAVILLVFTLLGLTVCGIFIYLKIILNVANVICILEDKYGFAALERSFSILQGRIQVALGTYLVTFLCVGFITLLFEYRITDKNDYTEHNSSATWEGPLLIILHSFMYLFADIMTVVLYFTCPKPSTFEALDASSRVPDVSSVL